MGEITRFRCDKRYARVCAVSGTGWRRGTDASERNLQIPLSYVVVWPCEAVDIRSVISF